MTDKGYVTDTTTTPIVVSSNIRKDKQPTIIDPDGIISVSNESVAAATEVFDQIMTGADYEITRIHHKEIIYPWCIAKIF